MTHKHGEPATPATSLRDAQQQDARSSGVLDSMLRDCTPAAAPEPDPTELDLIVDGRHIHVEAVHTLELRCGEAAIVLHADGRIEIRGTYITSRATATQRILGGSVNVN